VLFQVHSSAAEHSGSHKHPESHAFGEDAHFRGRRAPHEPVHFRAKSAHNTLQMVLQLDSYFTCSTS